MKPPKKRKSSQKPNTLTASCSVLHINAKKRIMSKAHHFIILQTHYNDTQITRIFFLSDKLKPNKEENRKTCVHQTNAKQEKKLR